MLHISSIIAVISSISIAISSVLGALARFQFTHINCRDCVCVRYTDEYSSNLNKDDSQNQS